MEEKRTLQQNKSIYKYFELVAKALNDAGYPIQEVLSNFTMDCEWTKESVKELLWKTAQKRMFGKSSTTQLNKSQEIDEIYEVMNRFLGEKLKIESIKFPSNDLDEELKLEE